MASTASIISGTQIAAQITEELAAKVSQYRERFNKVPGLAVVLVGDRKDSATYVRNKRKGCEKTGIHSVGFELPAETSEQELLQLIDQLNNDPAINGILVQLPLPKHLSENVIIQSIAPSKDVDGLHLQNVGSLVVKGPAHTPLVACTPSGCIELLKRTGVTIAGKNAVVIGRSNIVGKPVAQLLLANDATVTICHSRTPNIAEVTRQADIVVAAVGKPELVRGDWLKPGAVVIDVGINPVPDASNPRGYRLVGDVHFEEAKQVASAITPVPGGVGPMTIAMLLCNTVRAFETVVVEPALAAEAQNKASD
eukprot:TRINITY_DN2000_c0_g1_i2.p1 TRINITY_DN2000_c0_g1~~TRINITY_DN2000_c0_g1_i2.p1  ORF type:complete len:310 (-),score=117.41 TRINITY_DN2000_c0_g1_i2:219-1148(-)